MANLNLLLIEDNPEHAKLLTEALTLGHPGTRVMVGENGKRCLELAAQSDFDCLITDYNLPDYSADELLQALAPIMGDRPAVVVSSSADQRIAIRSFRSGGVDFIPKADAVNGDLLLRRVEAAIASGRGRAAAQLRTNQRLGKLLHQSETDELTGLSNRHCFDRIIAETPEDDRRKPLGAILFDIDHFKGINDRFGHAAGDALLRHIAQLIRKSLNPGEAAIRWGGEELLILRPADCLSDCWTWARCVRGNIEQTPLQFDGKEIRATISAGVTHLEHQRLGQSTIDQADQALYMAKTRGRNRVCTALMVQVELAAKWAGDCGNTDLAKRWESFQAICVPAMGATQHEHVSRHCHNVSQLAGLMARKMALPEQAVRRVELAGLLHDIGKMVVPDKLLDKTQALSEEEWAILGSAVAEGCRIAIQLGADTEIVDSLRHYHDPYNPPGGGQKPSIGARIVAVADAWEAMMTDRPYRKARWWEGAMAELTNGAGSQFDPDIVQIFRPIVEIERIASHKLY